jgi:hypothetical protein
MLKVFDREGKVNFVDDKNTVVGYDMNRHCCEKASWSFSRVSGEIGVQYLEESVLDKLVFDKNYFLETVDAEGLDRRVSFKLDGHGTWYLVLRNVHEGYYLHGFSMEVDNVTVRKGKL